LFGDGQLVYANTFSGPRQVERLPVMSRFNEFELLLKGEKGAIVHNKTELSWG